MAQQRNPFGCGRIAASTGLPCRRPGCDGTDHPVLDDAGHSEARSALAEHTRAVSLPALDPMRPIHNARIGLAAAQKRGASASTIQRWSDAVSEREQWANELGIKVTDTPAHMLGEASGAGERKPLGIEPTEDTTLALSYVADPMCQLGTCESCGGAAMLDTGAADVDRDTAQCLLNFCSSPEWILGCLDGSEVFDDDLEEKIWREAASIEHAVRSAWPEVEVPTVDCPRCVAGELDDAALVEQNRQLCTGCCHQVFRRLSALIPAPG